MEWWECFGFVVDDGHVCAYSCHTRIVTRERVEPLARVPGPGPGRQGLEWSTAPAAMPDHSRVLSMLRGDPSGGAVVKRLNRCCAAWRVIPRALPTSVQL